MRLVFESGNGSTAPRRYLALGDSYTIGEGVDADAALARLERYWTDQILYRL